MNKGILNLIVFTLFVLPWLVYLWCIPAGLKTISNLFTIIGLFISYYTLLATIGIALYIYTKDKNIKKNRLQNNETIEHLGRIMLKISTLFKSVPMFEISGKTRGSYMG